MDEELNNQEVAQAPIPAKAPNSKKKFLPLIIIFLALYLAAGVANYFFIKATYIPPKAKEEPKVEEKKPVLKIDLGELATQAGEQVGEQMGMAESAATSVPYVNQDSLRQARQDSARRADMGQVSNTINDLRAQIRQSDSLLVATRQELSSYEGNLKASVVETDSSINKKTQKLAKIVENMPPEEAAQMLQPLTDDQVIDILLRLKQRQAAQIMAALPAARSARISDAIMKPIVQR